MAIAFSNLGVSAAPDINSSTDATSYANALWTPPTADLIFVYVFSTLGGGGGVPNTPTMSGNSLTWTQIATRNQGVGTTDNRVTLFGANASGSTAGATTVDFAGQTQTCCFAPFAAATGVDLTAGVAAAFVQSPGSGSGTGATSGSITLAAAGNSANRPIAAFWHQANEVQEPRANWTELDDLNGAAPIRDMNTQYRGDAFETTASASWVTSTGWNGVAAELKATVVGAASLVIPRDLRTRHLLGL